MILLDTDHLTVLKYPESPQHALLTTRMQASADQAFATTAISVEEQVRGWLLKISQTSQVQDQVPYYGRFVELFAFFHGWHIVPFDGQAAAEFKALRKQRIRIGTMDLKIASIALVQRAKLLSANLRDFQKVPGLDVENWLS
jgi:tRNA(fMet)-specific endonuclease VapC